MNSNTRIFVAGHRGMVGSAICRRLRADGYQQILERSSADLDLRQQASVDAFFAQTQPQVVVLAAARVGGILANRDYPADFIQQNLQIQSNVIDAAYRSGVQQLLFLGSSCIYPRDCPQPMREEHLLTGPLEPTNRPYAVAKIAGIEQCWAYNRQYGTRYIAAMPTNLYGPGDNYHPQKSHVLPALIRKCHEAREAGADHIVLWGSGTPRREFLYSEDLAEACVHLLTASTDTLAPLFNDEQPPLINVGCGEDLTIRELAQIVAKVVGYTGEIRQDPSKPDGTPRKLMEVSRMRALGWQPSTDLDQGIAQAYADFLSREG